MQHTQQISIAPETQCREERGQISQGWKVEGTTRRGFEIASARIHDLIAQKSLRSGTRAAPLHLCYLEGVNAVTAALLLSVYRPADYPVSPDERFRWACRDTDRGYKAKGTGGSRMPKMTDGEYMAIWDKTTGAAVTLLTAVPRTMSLQAQA